jgi:hypothetical protein
MEGHVLKETENRALKRTSGFKRHEVTGLRKCTVTIFLRHFIWKCYYGYKIMRMNFVRHVMRCNTHEEFIQNSGLKT